MKHTLTVFLVFILIGCSQKSDPRRELEAKNIALFTEMNAKNMHPDSSGFDAYIDTYVDDAIVDRTPGHDTLPQGKAGLKAALRDFKRAFPNSKTTVEHIAADSDIVMVHTTITNTIGDGNDIMMLRYKDGKIVEHWSFH